MRCECDSGNNFFDNFGNEVEIDNLKKVEEIIFHLNRRVTGIYPSLNTSVGDELLDHSANYHCLSRNLSYIPKTKLEWYFEVPPVWGQWTPKFLNLEGHKYEEGDNLSLVIELSVLNWN